MSRPTPTLEAWLTELGQARAQGTFTVARTGRNLPWKAAQPTARRVSIQRFASRIAAAACVGLVLVGIWRMESRWTTPQPASPTPTLSLASRDATDATTITPTTDSTSIAATRVESLPGDYNGDGRVDGEDIQVYLNRQAQKPKSEGSKDASDFARKLLGS